MQRARRTCVSFRAEPRLGPSGAATHISNSIGILFAKHALTLEMCVAGIWYRSADRRATPTRLSAVGRGQHKVW